MYLPLTRRRSKFAFAALLGSVVSGLSGCGSLAADSSLSAAQVRFVQVSPGSPELDFYVNGSGAAYGIGYESFTSYLPVSPGTASFGVSRAGLGQPLVAAQSPLVGGHQYTVLVSHGLGSLQEHIFADQETPAPVGEVAVRVLNAVEGAPSITVHIGSVRGSASSPPVLNLGTASASAYFNVPAPGSYTVTATLGDHGLTFPLESVTVKAGSGAVRTVVFAGTAHPDAHSNVVGFVLEDADAT